MLKNETIMSGLGGTGHVELKVDTKSTQGLVGPLTDAEKTSIIADIHRKGFREIEAKREIVKGKWVTIILADI